MLHKAVLAAVLGVGLAIALAPTVALSENLTFRIKSEHENVVSLEFYSQSRNHVWPGNSKVYILDDYGTHTYNLSCRSGEKVCYGAWVRNRTSTYWGVGYNDRHGCESCCWICDGGRTPVVTLSN